MKLPPDKLFGAFAILVSTVLTATIVTAQVQTITATHTYVMGDRDSKEDARALCYMTAKRKVLEKAGVLIESSSEVKDFQLTKDQVNSYSAAILSVEVVKEEFGFNNGTNALTLTVKADVDMDEVRKRLAAIVGDKGLQAKVDAQQQQIRKMEQQLQVLNEKLSGASEGSKDEVQKDRDTELVAYYRLGAERGEAQAQYSLGNMYLLGKGVSQDNVQAYKWFNLAAARGDKKASELRDMVIERMPPAQLAEGKRLAREWRPTQALDLAPLIGTMEVEFQPMQSAGNREGCTLVYHVVGQDHAYRQGKLIGLVGNIAYAAFKNRGDVGLALKIGTIDALESNAKPESPFFAYIQTPHGTTARSKFVQFDSDTPGSRLFVYQLDEGAMSVFKDIADGAPVTIGFNRKKDGLDVLVPLDLHVVESTASDTGVKRRRSNEMLLQFFSCVAEVTERAQKQFNRKK